MWGGGEGNWTGKFFGEWKEYNRGCEMHGELVEEGSIAKIYVDINKYRSSKEKDK